MCGLIRVEKILSRDDAIKAKWIAVNTLQQQDVEMKGTSSYVVGRSSATLFAMDTIYGSTNKDDGDSGVVDNTERRVLDEVYVATDNPIHSLATNVYPSDSQVLRNHQVPLYKSDINTAIEVSTSSEDDAALYTEYQNLKSLLDEGVYDMVNDDEVGAKVTFEEWKTQKKQFKQGYSTTYSLTYSLTCLRTHS